MINKRKLYPAQHLVSQTYDGANNMQGKNNGLGVRIKKKCPMAVPTHCLCHSASLPVKNLFLAIDFLSKFQELMFEIIKLIKFSPTRENVLEDMKRNAPSDLMWDKSSE